MGFLQVRMKRVRLEGKGSYVALARMLANNGARYGAIYFLPNEEWVG